MVIRRIFSVAVIVVLLVALGPSDRVSDAPSTSSVTGNHNARYYLALGDSLTFGFQPSLFNSGDFSPADYKGYAEHYAARRPELTLVNYGCPGETSASILGKGRFPGCVYPGALHDSYDGAKTQAAAATAFLTAHPGQVDLISIDIGSNDLLQLLDSCKSKAHQHACLTRALPATLQTLRANYRELLSQLTTLAPDARIVLFSYYNPMAMKIRGSDTLVAQASEVVQHLANQFHADVAEAFAAINRSAGSTAERRSVCKRTWICSKYQDVHPTDLGYRALANALSRAAAAQ